MLYMVKKSSVLMVAVILLWGCAQPTNNTQKGAMYGTGVGTVVGAGLGQAIGGDTKSTLRMPDGIRREQFVQWAENKKIKYWSEIRAL